MAELVLQVPDIGDYKDVQVIELLVKDGDRVVEDQSLLTLETDKATIDVPAEATGIIRRMLVAVGDRVSQGDKIVLLETPSQESSGGNQASAPLQALPSGQEMPSHLRESSHDQPMPQSKKSHAQLVVVGGGPGGYTAAFRASDLGLQVVLIERYPDLGGVCLNVGCIPSKTLLRAAQVIEDASYAQQLGVTFSSPEINLDQLRQHKVSVITQLTQGLATMAKQRRVTLIQCQAELSSANTLELTHPDGKQTALSFDQCILATGSSAIRLPLFPWADPRILDSTRALALAKIPKTLLVVGGGIIGLEMATVYAALGSQVTVVEFQDQLIPGADPDLVRPLMQRFEHKGVRILLQTKASKVQPLPEGLLVDFDSVQTAPSAPSRQATFDCILVSVGRSPNGKQLQAERAGIQVTERGFIPVDSQMRTNIRHIYAVGDLVGNPMLAHKATHEGKLAAEVAAGHDHEWVSRVIPSVAYTDPEIAWIGVTEREAKAKQLEVESVKFPWAASGRALGLGRTEGFTKLVFDKQSRQVVGGAIVGVHAGELLAEIGLAIEMGAVIEDIIHTIHPHPTLSESVGLASELFHGSITDLYLAKKAS